MEPQLPQKGETRILEDESKIELRRFLLPWSLTDLAGEDFGRDFLLQLINEHDQYVQPETCYVQLKSHNAALSKTHKEKIEIKHLTMWCHERAAPLFVVVWSKEDKIFRCRSAKNIREEIDGVAPNWRNQQTVTVEFRKEHSFTLPKDLRTFILQTTQHELDSNGGISRLHRFRRSVLLTDLYYDTHSTSEIWGLANGQKIITGTGWVTEDLDPRDVDARRILVAALLLYEEIWFRLEFTPALLGVLGVQRFCQLVELKILIPYFSEAISGAIYTLQKPLCDFGGLITGVASPNQTQSHNIRLHKVLTQIKTRGGHDVLYSVLQLHTRLIPDTLLTKAAQDTKRDLRNSGLRQLLGLRRPVPKGDGVNEPFWDARLILRLNHMNYAMHLAAEYRIDVVEFESGLYRIAAEKWYSQLYPNKAISSVEALDTYLRRTGVPDLGLLNRELGTEACIDIALTPGAKAFREWFWEQASAPYAAGADLAQEFRKQAKKAFALTDDRAILLPCELRLRFFQKIGQTYHIGMPLCTETLGLSTRAEEGTRRLQQQRRNHAQYKSGQIQEFVGKKLRKGDKCPCESGDRYMDCCGRSIDR